MKKKVLAFLARAHGLNGLQALVKSPDFSIVALVTHKLLPKSEDSLRQERPEYRQFLDIAKALQLPFFTVDGQKEQLEIDKALLHLSYDWIVSISWRRLIPTEILEHASQGGVNLHRGRLPDYPGAEPIKQALLKGDSSVTISAHRLTPQLDEGELLAVYEHSLVHLDPTLPIEQRIAQIKEELTPHFGPLLLQALRKSEK